MNIEEAIKNDLSSIGFSHPFFSDIVQNTLNYIEKLEREKEEYRIGWCNTGEEVEKLKKDINKYKKATDEALKILEDNEKKDKVINEMAEYIGQDIKCVRPEIECNKMTHDCRECIKEYFTKKVEREGK